jgi:hypothetical protein
MTEWYEGQKIVCINANVSSHLNDPNAWWGPKFISQLKEGHIYTIDKIGYVMFDTLGHEDVAFLLHEVDTEYAKLGYPLVDKYGEAFYHFWHGRFKPLEEDKNEDDIDISIFQGLLNDVNDGKVVFDDEVVVKELEPAL